MTVQTPEWVKDAVFYQIFPDRFCRSGRAAGGLEFEPWESPPTVHGFKGGDLYGVAERLDYLTELGVTAIYLNPIFASASNHRYHTYDYYQVDPLLGGNDAFDELLTAAHDRGVRVVLDGVFNHASRGLWQFHHVLECGGDSPYRDWFHFDPARLSRQKHFAAYPDPKAQALLKAGRGSYEAIGYSAWWSLPALPKFNTDHSAVREFLLAVATHWIDAGIDGWRLDVPTEIDDDEFWREFRRRVKTINPEAYIVGEIWHAADHWLAGDQFDAVMNYPITAACLGFFGGAQLDLNLARQPDGLRHTSPLSAEEFAAVVTDCLDRYDPAVAAAQLNLLDSHDMPRFLSCVGEDLTALRLAALFLMTIPGAPCVYYGDEIGLAGGPDPDCRRSFPWDQAHWNHDLLDDYKQVIAARASSAALRRGDFHVLHAADGSYAHQRRLGDEVAIAAFNVQGQPATVDVALHEPPAGLTELEPLWGEHAPVRLTAGKATIELAPRSGAVLAARP